MKFNTLKERMEYYRDIVDYKLTPNSYVLAMVDGRAFSNLVKNTFQLPFDDSFISIMNETAAYVCKNIQGCKMAYTQSDEISFIITDFDTPETDAFFGFRLCKLQSIIASLATSKFNQLFNKWYIETNGSMDMTPADILDISQDCPLAQFDCKCWTVPSYNDVFAWFKYRQNDCTRNSKQQAAQTYLPHKQLLNKKTDDQIRILKEEKGIDWNTNYDNGKKYGRLIYKEEELHTVEVKGEPTEITRSVWKAHHAEPLTREYFDSLNRVPNRDIIEEKDPETIQDKMAYLVHEKSFIGCEGEILSVQNGKH